MLSWLPFTNCKLTDNLSLTLFHSQIDFFRAAAHSMLLDRNQFVRDLYGVYNIVYGKQNWRNGKSASWERRRRRQRRVMWKKQRNGHFNWLRLASSCAGSGVEGKREKKNEQDHLKCIWLSAGLLNATRNSINFPLHFFFLFACLFLPHFSPPLPMLQRSVIFLLENCDRCAFFNGN